MGRTQPSWCKYYQRVIWESAEPVPKSLLVLKLGNHGTFIYSRCAPFRLEADECSSWLTWEVLPIPDSSSGIKMLHVIPGKDPFDPANRTGISSLIQYALYSQQIMHYPLSDVRSNDQSPTMVSSSSNTLDRHVDEEDTSNPPENTFTSLTSIIGCRCCFSD